VAGQGISRTSAAGSSWCAAAFPALIVTVNNLAIHLAEAGRRTEGLAAAEEEA